MNGGNGTATGGGGESFLVRRSGLVVIPGSESSESEDVWVLSSDSLELDFESLLSLEADTGCAGTGVGLTAIIFLLEGPGSFSASDSLEDSEDEDDEDSDTFLFFRLRFRLRWVDRLGAGAVVDMVEGGKKNVWKLISSEIDPIWDKTRLWLSSKRALCSQRQRPSSQ